LEFIEQLFSEKAEILPADSYYGNKIQVVFSHIKEVLSSDLDTKILVFSAYTEALTILGKLFSSHQIKYSSGESGAHDKTSQIDQFRFDQQNRVLLLNALKQSTGLTLTQANHIFLMDPIDESSELQTVGRAYRLGQTRCTNIYRYCTEEDNGINYFT